MQVTDHMILGPSLCFLCEMAPSDVPAIDTLRDHRPPAPCTLDGRKYVCAHCAGSMAHLLGWVNPATRVALENELEAVKIALAEADKEIAAREEFISALESLRPYLPELPLPAAPVKKPAPKKPAA